MATGAGAASLAEVQARGSLVVLWASVAAEGDAPQVASNASPMAEGSVDEDLLRAFAGQLGVEPLFRRVPVDRIIPTLLRGEGDVIAGAFSITSERQRLVTFSDPYYPVFVMAVGRAADRLESVEELRGAVACVRPGSSQASHLDRLGVRSKQFVEDAEQCFERVETGAADLLLIDSPYLFGAIDRHPALEAKLEVAVEQYGFAVSPDSDLAGAINRFLEQCQRTGCLYQAVLRREGVRAAQFFRLYQDRQAGRKPVD